MGQLILFAAGMVLPSLCSSVVTKGGRLYANTRVVLWHGGRSLGRTKSTSATAVSETKLERFKKFMNEPRIILDQKLSLSQYVGRASYLCSIAAFADTDMLSLRLFALLSSTFALSFQFIARPSPQKIPLHWGVFLMGINAYMASSLYLEKMKAEYMGEEMEKLYRDGDFDRLGFGRVEFLKFFDHQGECAPTKHRVEEGKTLVVQGLVNSKLFYIVDGCANVIRNENGQNKHLATVEEHEFVGEMSLVEAIGQKTLSIRPTSASVVAGAGGATVYEWGLLELRTFMWKDRQVANALQTYVCHDLRKKLSNTNDGLRLARGTSTNCNGEKKETQSTT